MPAIFYLNSLYTDRRRVFRVQIWPNFRTHVFPEIEIVLLSLSMNGSEGRGILIRRKLNNPLSTQATQLDFNMNPILCTELKTSVDFLHDSSEKRRPGLTEDIPEIVSFDSKLALSVGLVGGKGASLARLERGRKSEVCYFHHFLPVD